MENSTITTELIAGTMISDLLERWPETAVLFNKFNMACVGCVVAPFYSVDDAIAIYGVQRDEFLAKLLLLIQE